ncbi:hypothetical protein RIF29_21665 [Crotalaria pallida]|uniref:Uncharacterized protein n=1 Tax=Crotalaria pallida TaxID=3830 RepID=A0AAN9F554_CROPI
MFHEQVLISSFTLYYCVPLLISNCLLSFLPRSSTVPVFKTSTFSLPPSLQFKTSNLKLTFPQTHISIFNFNFNSEGKERNKILTQTNSSIRYRSVRLLTSHSVPFPTKSKP